MPRVTRKEPRDDHTSHCDLDGAPQGPRAPKRHELEVAKDHVACPAQVLPTEIILAHLDPKTLLYCKGTHEGTGLRSDGLQINSRGMGLPSGILHACGFNPDEPEESTLCEATSNYFGFSSGSNDTKWT